MQRPANASVFPERSARRAPLLALLLLAFLAPDADAAPKSWWNRDWRYRKRIVLKKKQRWADAGAAHVRLGTGGQARPEGSDIRIVTKAGKVVSRVIVGRGPGDLFEVAFPVGSQNEWFVYYGNPEAKEPPDPYVLDRGLILETRARGPGTPKNWPATAQILKNSTAVHGGAFWPRIFDAENPFGPSDNYVSIYRGFINCPVDGTYTFYTASDEASFLFVAGKLVAQWPGWHNARQGAWGKFKGNIKLKKGLHPIRYVHVERVGNQVMAAYWRVPGGKKGRVIPDTAFPGLLDVDIMGHEVLGKDVAADFNLEVTHKWGLDNRVYSGVTLKANLTGKDAKYAWDFGDGVQGEGPITYHVYLMGGDYDVSLTVSAKGQSDIVIRTVHVPDQWTRFDRNRPEVLARFARILATYPGERLDPEALTRLGFLLEVAGREDDMIEIAHQALRKNPLLDERRRFALAMRLGGLYRDLRRDLEKAVWAFREASILKNRKFRARGQVALAEALLELGGDPQVARKLLDQAIRELGEEGGETLRRAYLRSGDSKMLTGDAKNALADYERAAELAGGPENAKRLLRKAAATRSAMTFLEAGDTDRARQQLADWEWNAPEDRWRGLHRIVKSKYLVAISRPDDAVRELLALVKSNPASEYADQALFLLAGIERDRGREPEADAYLERLKTDYPWSPLAK